MSDCGNCRKKNKCAFIDAEWFPIGVISFCRPQMLFLIANIEALRQGIYPSQDVTSGYTRIDEQIRTQPRQTAPYEKAVQIASEVDTRLDRCGIEGKLLEMEVQSGKGIEDFMICRECYDKYCPSLKALNYVSGWRRRRQSYLEWKKKTKYRQKEK